MLHVEPSLERAVDLGVGYNVGDVACESEAHTLAYGCETRDVDGRTVEVRAVDFGGGQELEAVEAHAVIACRAFGHIEQHLKRRDGILGRTIGASETHGAWEREVGVDLGEFAAHGDGYERDKAVERRKRHVESECLDAEVVLKVERCVQCGFYLSDSETEVAQWGVHRARGRPVDVASESQLQTVDGERGNGGRGEPCDVELIDRGTAALKFGRGEPQWGVDGVGER